MTENTRDFFWIFGPVAFVMMGFLSYAFVYGIDEDAVRISGVTISNMIAIGVIR